jgi:hypothetical protein
VKFEALIFDGDAAQLVVGQAQPLGQVGEGLRAFCVRDGTMRIGVYAEGTGRVAILPWSAIATLATDAGVDQPPITRQN